MGINGVYLFINFTIFRNKNIWIVQNIILYKYNIINQLACIIYSYIIMTSSPVSAKSKPRQPSIYYCRDNNKMTIKPVIPALRPIIVTAAVMKYEFNSVVCSYRHLPRLLLFETEKPVQWAIYSIYNQW